MKPKRGIRLEWALLLIWGIFLVSGITTTNAGAQENVGLIQLAATGQGRAHALAYSPDGNRLAVGTSLGIFTYETQSLAQIYSVSTETWVRALAFSPDGGSFATGSYDPVVRIYQASDGVLLKELVGHTAWVRALAYSPEGNLLATASDDNTVRLWDVPDGTELSVFAHGTEGVRALAISPDGMLLATGGYDQQIRLWRISDGALLRELEGHNGWVRTLAFSPDGDVLASGGFDTSVRLWRVSSGELLETRTEHSSSVLGLAFSPDGSLLASASVDSSVRLWRMPNLEAFALLKGHTDFVYSVSFSPDGQKLASGGVDNTVRVWDVPRQSSDSAQEILPSSSNCVSCHHPLNPDRPARVFDVSCTTCHTNGTLVRTWDPAFPRAGTSNPITVVSEPGLIPGVPTQMQDFAVVIANPGNGETYYAGDKTPVYSAQINGLIYSNSFPPEDIHILFEILQDDRVIDSIQTQPDWNGHFSIAATVNAHSLVDDEAFPSPVPKLQARCGESCHYRSDVDLSSGSLYLKVTATAPDGSQVYDSRAIRVDYSGTSSIPVQIVQEDGQVLPNILVQAETRLYEWRGRTINAVSNGDGAAVLLVEALSQAPTTYQLSVPPTFVDGTLYESTESTEVTLLPGAVSAPLVTLKVRSHRGAIIGSVPNLDTPISIWAIHLPDGGAQQVQLSPEGEFAFSDLPISHYLLTTDPQALAAQGLVLEALSVDLTQSLTTTVELIPQALEGVSLQGRVLDEAGSPLPFAWFSTGKQLQPSEPMGGMFALHGLEEEEAVLVVSAPGYYSQARVSDASSMDFYLVRQTETLVLPREKGEVILPPETVARLAGEAIIFERGWLWGEVGEPLVIELDEGFIKIQKGRFALERLPGKAAWFYLFSGQAQVQSENDELPVEMGSVQMVRLEAGEEILPVAYDPVVVQALRGGEDLPISVKWQSSLNAQIRDRIASLGINAAQLVTFVTYSIALLTLIVAPVLALHWKLRNRQEKKHE